MPYLPACLLLALLSLSLPLPAEMDNGALRILTWEGYVTEQELQQVNQQLAQQGYPYRAEVVQPYAEGAEQMFDLIRSGKVDIAFLTLFFIKIEREQTSRLLQAININSPRLTNYLKLQANLTHIPMGLNQAQQPLYIPWGGGAYGFYVNRDKVAETEIPTSVSELWQEKWRGKYSLNKSQEWYNVGLSLMSLGQSPFRLHQLVQHNERKQLLSLKSRSGELQQKLSALYENAGHFWKASPQFNDDLLIVSSWGPEITRENNKGGNWQMISFKEGHMVWLDTINFVKNLSGRKLEAAEIFANYFIGKEVQSRITRELSMVAAASEVTPNKQLGTPDKIFRQNMFVPPYNSTSYSIMKVMTDKASEQAPALQ